MRVLVRLAAVAVLLTSPLIGCSSDDDGDDEWCGSHEYCESDQTCYGEACVDIFRQPFVVTALDGTASTTEDWDDGGGAPDPYVVLGFGSHSCETSVQQDTFEPSWDEGCTFWFTTDGGLSVDMYDEDDTDDHTMLIYQSSGDDELIELVRNMTTEIANASASVTIKITPDL